MNEIKFTVFLHYKLTYYFYHYGYVFFFFYVNKFFFFFISVKLFLADANPHLRVRDKTFTNAIRLYLERKSFITI
jgi:hypothetical protein